MNRLSSTVKAFIALVIVVLLLGAAYIYWNNRQFASEQGVSMHTTEIATSTQEVARHIISRGLIIGKNAVIVDTRFFDVTGVSNSNRIYALVYTTDSTADDLVKSYKGLLPVKGYSTIKTVVDGDRTELTAGNATSSMTIDIKPLNGAQTVTILSGETI